MCPECVPASAMQPLNHTCMACRRWEHPYQALCQMGRWRRSRPATCPSQWTAHLSLGRFQGCKAAIWPQVRWMMTDAHEWMMQ